VPRSLLAFTLAFHKFANESQDSVFTNESQDSVFADESQYFVFANES